MYNTYEKENMYKKEEEKNTIKKYDLQLLHFVHFLYFMILQFHTRMNTQKRLK